MKRLMKRAACILLSIMLVYNSAGIPLRSSAYGKSELMSATVMIPAPTGIVALVEGEAVITTELYMLARAYYAMLMNYPEENFDPEAYLDLLERTTMAFEMADIMNTSLEKNATALEMLENAGVEGLYEEPTVMPGHYLDHFDLQKLYDELFAAEAADNSEAMQYAQEVTKIFDEAKNGEKLKTLAKAYGTDIPHARAMLEQANAIIEGEGYENYSKEADKSYKLMVETKAAASVTGFGVAVIATGGVATTGAASLAGVVEAGGLVCNGINTIVDVGNAVILKSPDGEDSVAAATLNTISETYAPISALFAIGGTYGAYKDFKNPEKAAEKVCNAANMVLTVVGFGRDYVQDDVILGLNADMREDVKKIWAESCNDVEKARELLKDMGLAGEAVEIVEDILSGADGIPGIYDPYTLLEESKELIDSMIEEYESYTDPEDPFPAEEYTIDIGEKMIDAVKEIDGIEDISEEIIETVQEGMTEEEPEKQQEDKTEEPEDTLEWLTDEDEEADNSTEDSLDWLTEDEEADEPTEDSLDWLTEDEEVDEPTEDSLDWLTDEEEADDSKEDSLDWLTDEDEEVDDPVDDSLDWLMNEEDEADELSDDSLGWLMDEDDWDEAGDSSFGGLTTVDEPGESDWDSFDWMMDEEVDDEDYYTEEASGIRISDATVDTHYDDAYYDEVGGEIDEDWFLYDWEHSGVDVEIIEIDTEKSEEDEKYKTIELFNYEFLIPDCEIVEKTESVTNNFTNAVRINMKGIDYDEFLEYCKKLESIPEWEPMTAEFDDLPATPQRGEYNSYPHINGCLPPFYQLVSITSYYDKTEYQLEIFVEERFGNSTTDGTSILSAYNANL